MLHCFSHISITEKTPRLILSLFGQVVPDENAGAIWVGGTHIHRGDSCKAWVSCCWGFFCLFVCLLLLYVCCFLGGVVVGCPMLLLLSLLVGSHFKTLLMGTAGGTAVTLYGPTPTGTAAVALSLLCNCAEGIVVGFFCTGSKKLFSYDCCCWYSNRCCWAQLGVVVTKPTPKGAAVGVALSLLCNYPRGIVVGCCVGSKKLHV